MPKKNFSLIDSLTIQFLKENIGKKFTVYNVWSLIGKKYPEIKISHPVFYKRIHQLLSVDKNLKSERLGYYILVWYEEPKPSII
jgi:hypothetical protein